MKILNRIVSVIIVGIIFYFLIANLITNWQKIPFDELRINIPDLFLSFLFLSVYFLIFIAGWKKIVKGLGESLSYKKGLWIVSTSQIAKYLPGGIWYTLGRVYLCKIEGMKGQIVFISIILETCFLMLTNMVLFLISISFLSDSQLLHPLISIAIIMALLLFLYPPLFNRLVDIMIRILKREPISLKLSYLRMLSYSLYFIGVWIAQIIGFFFLIRAIYPLEITHIFSVSAAYTLAWIVGFIVLFAPAGLGVREGVLTLILSAIMPTPLAIAISFISRVWITVFEVIVFFIGLLIRRKEREDKI